MERRGVPARIGIVLLNLLWPGVGLLRTGRPRVAILLLCAPLLIMLLIRAVFHTAPGMTLVLYLGTAAAAAALLLAAYLASFVLSWTGSRVPVPYQRWWRRWYGIVALAFAFMLAASLLTMDRDILGYRPFYLPSDGMAPTLVKNDTVVAAMGQPARPRRGDIILHEMDGQIFVKRVAALEGDRVALVHGLVTINGQALEQRLVAGSEQLDPLTGQTRTQRTEQFPGEARPHLIYDRGVTDIDEFPETVVPAGRLFLLGDNRDESADSRLPRDRFGTGMVPVATVVGRPIFHLWDGSRPAGAEVGD